MARMNQGTCPCGLCPCSLKEQGIGVKEGNSEEKVQKVEGKSRELEQKEGVPGKKVQKIDKERLGVSGVIKKNGTT